MDKFYKERFEALNNLVKKTAPLMEVNEIIEKVREELRNLIPNAMEVCILLLDPDAEKYTSPLQCALYETPVSCQACKRDRPAVQKAISQKKPVVVSQSEPIRRMDNTLVAVGPEYAIPVLIENRVLAVVSVLFLDLEGYTKLSSIRPDTEVNEVIEKMFSSFVDPIHRSHGDINETSGDALMIIFKNHDAPTNAINAVKAAFEIAERNRVINESLKSVFQPIEVNIGINSGSALVGMTRFMGSLDTRMTCTASGSVTNIAARLSDHAKGGDILIGKKTKNMIEGVWPCFDRGFANLKGI
jgi:class 3 adenylate cyclase